MKFGIGLFSLQTHRENPVSHAEICKNTLEQVKLAEKSNFYSAWISEHHFLEDGYCPSPLILASAMAAVTTSIRLGTAGIILPLYNPIRVAEDSALVDNISNGRLDLGVVLGYRKEEFEGFGIPIKQRPSRMEEGIEIVIRAWTEEGFSFEGKRYRFRNVNVTPKPVQKPHPPVYIGAFEEPAIRRAGRLGYPLLIGPGRTIDMIRETIRIYNESAKKAGNDPDKVEHILLREVYVGENKKKAREEAERYIISMYRYYFSLGVKMFVRGRQLTGLDDPMFEYLPEDRFIIGDPEECIREIQRYRDELGIRYITCRMVFPQATHKAISECIKLFGKEVIPNFM
ncbi:MAG: luciferase [Deltaproteobacteria bacterium]|jgi:alkanesulfonate monooxygenase SsuD/methylene tetrahydromethanopterin reductase-like flavin-dependent oxidoreductase (luciferase family)|nr:MAG: luciferase [Deltaproteobacteria bacterium]